MQSKQLYKSILSLVFNYMIIVYPIILFCLKTSDLSYMVTSSILALPVALLVSMINNRTCFVVLTILILFSSLVEVVMVVIYGTFIMTGNISAMITTNAQESADFIKNNLFIILYFIPVVALAVGAILVHSRIRPLLWVQSILLVLSLAISIGYVSYKQSVFYKHLLTNRFYLENYILTRPPYNFWFQSVNAVKVLQKKSFIKLSEGFEFGAERIDSLSGIRESYVLAIGESLRYDNFSLNGLYPRTTTPMLESLDNVVLYDNYYSTAVQTLCSVPMIITRAVPDSFDLSYKEKSIILPYKETKFKTFAIACNLLSDHGQEYLTYGVDSLFRVKHDKDIPGIIDSLTDIYPKTFFLLQFHGCHSFYDNYESEFDVYHPNRNSEPNAESDSLWINAYDNTILYADYILRKVIESINKRETISLMLFVSDHGEEVTSGGGGHAANCKPTVQEYHVPCVVWYSETYSSFFPDKVTNLVNNRNCPVSGDNIFYSACDLSGIILPKKYKQKEYSFFSDSLVEHKRSVLLPDCVNILRCE